MKITYDKEIDALYIKLSEKKIVESEEVQKDVIIDFDENNEIVGIEVLHFVRDNKEDVFPVFKNVEQAAWGFV
ncbi:MAG: DUF2283 domain-containing protein [Bacteroidales bacterium]|nr:DUF2283 domain-containing protein [Bacteroidales bacterium]MBN2758351.1 DUF2283 domain-containing protein [Bacteroidales bacterium]